MVAFILLMLPSVSAVETNIAEKVNQEKLAEEMENVTGKVAPNCFFGKIFRGIFLVKLFRGLFGGAIEAVFGLLALPVIVAFLTVFGGALTAAISIAFPLLGILAKIISMIYGSLFGVTTYTLKALLIVAILLLF